jgi:predicted ATPase
MLIGWFADSKTPRITEFNRYYSRLFSGRTLSRVEVGYATSKPDIFFADARGREYELSEVSAGERALMPVLLDFVQWGIHNSVILIDEIELHLHPPLQRALVMLLPDLGKNNQFIITTHSNDVYDIMPGSAILRVD